jgi:hypothetical protein
VEKPPALESQPATSAVVIEAAKEDEAASSSATKTEMPRKLVHK